MPNTAKELLEQENKAGNDEDGLSVGQQSYDEKFNHIAQHTENEEFNDIIAREYGSDDTKRTDAHGDTVLKNYNADEPTKNIDNIRDQEETSSLFNGQGVSSAPKPASFGTRLQGFVKKKGPSLGVAGFIIGGFLGMSSILMPGALLVMMEKGATNFSMEDTRTNIVMRRSYIGGLFSKGNADSDLKKKMTRMSETQKAAWEKQNFKIEADQDGKFYKIKSIEFPDGTKVTTAADFHNHVDNNVDARRASEHVFNSRSSFRLSNPKFEQVFKKFKLSRGNVLEASTDKDKAKRTEAINKSFDENAETSSERDGRLSSIKSKFDSDKGKFSGKFKKGASKIVSVADVIATACMAYNTARATNATIKGYWIYQLVKFAYPFIQAASQIEDQGNIEPEVVENISDRLTWYISPDYADTLAESGEDPQAHDKVNQTAMDSQGLKAALYGDYSALEEFTKTYTTGLTAVAMKSTAVINYAQNVLGKDNIHKTCKTANAISFAGIALCANSPLSVAICAIVAGGLLAFGDEIIQKVAEEMAEPAMNAIADANLSSSLRGVDAGNALAAGIGLFLTQGNFGSGNRPGTNVDQAKKFITATDELNYKYDEEIARAEAKETPFDMYNKYSFAGQVAAAVNPYQSQDGTTYNKIANLFATLASPLGLLSQSASALYHQPSQFTAREGSAEGIVGNCTDPDMLEVGFICDWSGRPITYITPEVIDEMTDQSKGNTDATLRVIDYMSAGGYITAEGKATGDTNTSGPEGDEEEDEEKYNYIKYKNYCTNERIDPPGTSSQPIEQGSEDDQRWYTMERCAGDPNNQKEQTMLNNFFIYYNMCETQIPSANGVENCWSDAATTPATTNTGEWVIPTVGPCISKFGQRNGTLHAGVDISPDAGTPIVAPTSMKIISASDKGDAYGYSVVARATDGTGHMFRFAHMASPPPVSPGQEVAKGQNIGVVGSTGDSSGPHLHFEIYAPGTADGAYASNGSPVDPIPVLKDHGVTLVCTG